MEGFGAVTTTLHLIRHGEATRHEAGADPELSSLGVRQALAVAARVARFEADEIIHSPKRRATETAHIISERLGLPTAADPMVDDRTPFPEDRSDVPSRYHGFLDCVPLDERDVGGRRLDGAIEALSGTDDGHRHIIVVTHNFVIGWFIRRALDAPWWRWLGLNQDNGALTTITYGIDGARLVAFNDAGHLLPHPSE